MNRADPFSRKNLKRLLFPPRTIFQKLRKTVKCLRLFTTWTHDFGTNGKHVLRDTISVTYRAITRRCIPGIDLNQKHDRPLSIEPTAAADRAPPTLSFDTRSRSDEFLSERNVVVVHDVRRTKGVDTETSRPGGGGICTYCALCIGMTKNRVANKKRSSLCDTYDTRITNARCLHSIVAKRVSHLDVAGVTNP